MQRPSVLFINKVYPSARGTSGRLLRDLARSFAREGWHVNIITSGKKTETFRDGPLRITKIKASQDTAIGFFGFIRLWLLFFIAAMKEPKRHLVITMSDPPLISFIGYCYAKLKNSNHMHWCQIIHPEDLKLSAIRIPRVFSGIVKALHLKALEQCQRIVVVGRCMARQLTLLGIDPTSITVIPNWSDFELSKPLTQNHNFAKKQVQGARSFEKLIKGEPKFRVLYAGSIHDYHPMDVILDAAQILDKDFPDIEFTFVGEGDGYDELSLQRAKRDIGNIRLLPYQPVSRLKAMMESGDIHLISMTEEASGYTVSPKLYAALASQRPCVFIGPEQSETAKVIRDFEAGVVVPPDNARSLAENIKTFRMSGETWYKAQEGSIKAGKVFIPKQSIEAWLERAWDVISKDFQLPRKQGTQSTSRSKQSKAASIQNKKISSSEGLKDNPANAEAQEDHKSHNKHAA